MVFHLGRCFKLIELKSEKDVHTLLKVRKLYLEVFPDFERLPFWYLIYKSKKKDSNLNVIYDGGKFIGFTHLVYYKDIVYLYYLAIDPSQQSQGYGSLILEHLQTKYLDKRMLLNIEKVDITADNYIKRFKRKKFYEKNGFQNTSFEIETEDIVYEILYSGAIVYEHEYDSLFKSYISRIVRYLFL